MRKFLFLFLVLCLVGGLNAQTALPFEQNFNSGTGTSLPTGWTSSGASATIQSWGVGNSRATRANVYGTSSSTTNQINTPLIGPISAGTVIDFQYRIGPCDAGDVYELIHADDRMEVLIRVGTTGDFTSIKRIDNSSPEYVHSDTWQPLTVAIPTSYVGENVTIAFKLTKANTISGSSGATGWDSYFGIDDVSVYMIVDHDLIASSLNIQGTINVNTLKQATARITNNGLNVASGYSVKLMQVADPTDIQLAINTTGPSIASGEFENIQLSWTPTTTGAIQIYAEVVYAADEVPTNNKTGNVNISVYQEGILEIVTGDPSSTASSNSYPVNYFYQSSMAQSIYYSTDMQFTGNLYGLKYNFTGAGAMEPAANSIIEFYLATTSANTFSNTTAWISASEFTHVFSGVLPVTTAGNRDIEIIFDAPYNYQGGNLVVMTKRQLAGDYQSGNTWKTTAVTGNRTLYKQSDDDDLSLPANYSGAGTQAAFIPNTTFLMGDVPIVNLSQSNLSFGEQQILSPNVQDFSILYAGNETLTITAVSFTGANASDFSAGFDLSDLPYTILPFQRQSLPIKFNALTVGNKSAQLVVTHSLGTATVNLSGVAIDNSLKTFPFTENFTSTTFPPTSWSRYAGRFPLTNEIATSTLATSTVWTRTNFANTASHANGGAARVNITGTTRYDWLVTPLLDLRGLTNTKLLFDLALTANGNANTPATTGTDDRFLVLVSTDSGITWSTSNILALWDNDEDTEGNEYNSLTPDGQSIILDLSTYSGIVKIAFYGESTVTNANNDLFVDNIRVMELFDTPVYEISPEALAYGDLQIESQSAPRTLTITNWGSQNLSINSLNIMGSQANQFSIVDYSDIVFPIIIPAFDNTSFSTYSFDVIFAPTTVGAKNASIVIYDNITRAFRNIPLSGNGVETRILNFPWTETFNTFLPASWERRDILLPASGDVTMPTAVGAGWTASTGFANNASHQFGPATKINVYGTSKYGWLITPNIAINNITGDKQLEFDLALTVYNNTGVATGTRLDDKFIVLWSENGGVTWNSDGILALWDNDDATAGYVFNDIATAGQKIVIPIPPTTSSAVRFAFYGESTVSNGDNDLHIDNVTVRQTPTAPMFTIDPESFDFGPVGVTNSVNKSFTIKNIGFGDLIINSFLLGDDVNFTLTNTNELPYTIAPETTMSFQVAFSPTVVGDFTTNISITDNLTRAVRTIPLTGEGFVPPIVTDVTIGTGTTGVQIPTGHYFNYNYNQTIHHATEIGGSMSINRISYFYRGEVSAPNAQAWRVYLGHTDKQQFASTTDWVQLNGEPQFEGTVSLVVQAGGYWIDIDLDTPFEYNGMDNLAIGVWEYLTGYTGTSTNTLAFNGTIITGSNTNRAMYRSHDSGTNTQAANLTTAGTRTTTRPNIRLQNLPFFTAPTALAATPGDGQISLTWTAPAAGSSGTFASYTVYRNNAQIATGITGTTYVDNTATTLNSYDYYVTAVYTTPAGESKPSNIVTATPLDGDYKGQPYNLTAALNGSNVVLNWMPAGGTSAGWLSHLPAGDNSNTTVSFGATYTGKFAHKFTPAQLSAMGLQSGVLSKVSLQFSNPSLLANVRIQVWQVPTGTAPGTPIVDVPVSHVTNNTTHHLVWQTFDLPEWVTIDPTQDLWIGCQASILSLTQGGTTYYGGVGANNNNATSTTGFGDLIYVDDEDGFVSIMTYAATWNVWTWAIRGFAEYNGTPVPISPITSYPTNDVPTYQKVSSLNRNFTLTSDVASLSVSNKTTRNTRAFLGYDVFRGTTRLNTTPLFTLTYTDLNTPAGSHTYKVYAVYTNGYSNPAETTISIGLNAPTNLVATPGVLSASLTWNAPTIAPGAVVSGYNIYRDNVRIASNIEELTYTNTGLVKYRTYVYQVTAVYTTPVGESEKSNSSSAVPFTPTTFPVTNLTAEYENNAIVLNWDNPNYGTGVLSHTTQNTHTYTFGAGADAPTDWTIVHRYLPEMLSDMGLSGSYLTQMSTIPGVAGTTITAKVWTGGSSNPLTPGNLVYDEVVTTGEWVSGAWVSHTLSTPVLIPNNQELWIGFNISGIGYATTQDNGPLAFGVPGYGDVVNAGSGWVTADALYSGNQENWMIRGYAERNGVPVPISPSYSNRSNRYDNLTVSYNKNTRTNTRAERIMNTRSETLRDLNGFKVSRIALSETNAQWESLTTNPITTNTYTDTALNSNSYGYRVVALFSGVESTPVDVYISIADNNTVVIDTFPYEEGFNHPLFAPVGWTTVDADGDGHNWELHATGAVGTAAGSRSQGLTPDNWLVTPKIILPSSEVGHKMFIEYKVAGTGTPVNENYGLYISTTTNDIENFVLLNSETLSSATYATKTVDLSNYEGQEFYLAFRHFNSYNRNHLRIDSILIEEREVTEPIITVNPAVVDFGYIFLNDPFKTKNVVITNTGVGDLIIGSMTFNTTFTSEFNYIPTTTPLPVFLATGESINFTVELTATAIEDYTATLTILSNLAPRVIEIKGRAVNSIPPENLVSVNTNDGVLLTWDAPERIIAGTHVGYNVYRGDEFLAYVDDVVGTYTDMTVAVGQSYSYKVTAVIVDPASETDPSASATITVAVTAVTALQSSVTNQTVNLTWTAPTGSLTHLIGYRVLRGETVLANETEVTASPYAALLQPNGNNTYSVIAVYQIGASAAANVQANVQYFETNAPRNFTATQAGFTVVTNWLAPNPGVNEVLSGYKVYKDNASLSGLLGTTTLTYTDNNPVAGATHVYYVEAVYSTPNTTETSTEASVQIVVAPATNVTAVAVTNNVTVSWTAAAYANTLGQINRVTTQSTEHDAKGFSSTRTATVSSENEINNTKLTQTAVSSTKSGNRSFVGYRVYRGTVELTTTPITALVYNDNGLANGTYTYSVIAVYSIGNSVPTLSNEVNVHVSDIEVVIVDKTELRSNYPNPFNPTTTIEYAMKNEGHVTIEIFNAKGQLVRTLVNTTMGQGIHVVTWNGLDNNGRTASSGMYFYRMVTNDYTSMKKMTIMK